MSPNAAVPAPASTSDVGINAVLLGPPGSGKGTQVRQMRINTSSLPLYNERTVLSARFLAHRHRG